MGISSLCLRRSFHLPFVSEMAMASRSRNPSDSLPRSANASTSSLISKPRGGFSTPPSHPNDFYLQSPSGLKGRSSVPVSNPRWIQKLTNTLQHSLSDKVPLLNHAGRHVYLTGLLVLPLAFTSPVGYATSHHRQGTRRYPPQPRPTPRSHERPWWIHIHYSWHRQSRLFDSPRRRMSSPLVRLPHNLCLTNCTDGQ